MVLETTHQSYEAFVCESKDGKEEWISLGSMESKYLTSEVTEGFTGVLLAAYCEADENGDSGFVKFETIV